MVRNVLAVLAGTVLLVLGFMFSLVIFAVIAVVGLALWGYLLWKTRKIRQAMREQAPNGHVIDGEAVVVEDYPGPESNILPGRRPEA
jgi:membrane protein implicated in regulation of membrane protease activity